MTILAASTADLGLSISQSGWYLGTQGVVTASTAHGARTGTKAWRVQSAWNYFKFPAVTEFYARAGLFYPSGELGYWQLACNDVSYMPKFYMRYDLGEVQAWATPTSISGIKLAAGSGLFMDTWQCFECYIKLADVGGRMVAKLDGQIIIDYTGDILNTTYGPTTVGSLLFYCTSTQVWVDDLVVRDDGWPGQGGLYVRRPNGAGSYSGWTPSAGTALDCVNDDPMDMTDYLGAPATPANVKHSFAVEDTPSTLALSDIKFVMPVAYGALDASGLGLYRNFLLSNGQVANGSTKSLSGSDAMTGQDFVELNPDGDVAWTQAAVDALEQGVETLGQGS